MDPILRTVTERWVIDGSGHWVPRHRRVESVITECVTVMQFLAPVLGVDWTLLSGQVDAESDWNPAAVGAVREIGLAQIKLTTVQDFHQAWTEDDLRDPVRNVIAQYEYLNWLKEWLYRAFLCTDYRFVLAAYNWGPGNVRKHLNERRPFEELPDKVRGYVLKVYERAERIKRES